MKIITMKIIKSGPTLKEIKQSLESFESRDISRSFDKFDYKSVEFTLEDEKKKALS